MTGPVCARPPVPRPRCRGVARVIAVLAVLACGGMFTCAPAVAQQPIFGFPPAPPPPPKSAIAVEREKAGNQQQMLVKANEIDYDYANHRVSAVGDVQIYFRNSTLEADKVIYTQNTKRLHAEGNVRLSEVDGKVTYGSIMDLSDDYRDGFVDSLRLDTPERTRMAAARAERTSGNTTVFHSGVYTACLPCKDDPKKPPLWQVKAARIIHDQGEKMIYFEDARLEFFGQPIAWLPYFSAPDPTVKRKTGVLVPSIKSSTIYGLALEVPYYWALAPDYDATFAPMITTKQGALLQGEFRQRLLSGAYSIRAAGIYQLDPGYFANTTGVPAPGDRNFRGSVESSGQFAINDKWVWGWDGVLLTDKTFLSDYNPRLSSLSLYRYAGGRRQFRPLADLSLRQGQPQLFRHPLDLLLRLLDGRRAETDSGHPSGARLRLYVRSSDYGRRARIQYQFHQPDARPGRVRRDQSNCGQRRHLFADRQSDAGQSEQLPAARHSRHL